MNKSTFLCLWLLALLAPIERSSAADVSDFADFSLRIGTFTLLPGRLYVPPAAVADPDAVRPLILFLHGAGESGTNNLAQINGNIDNLLAEAKRRNAFLLAPQTNAGWTSATTLDRVKSMIDQAVADQPVDPSRLYVTGLSMGGGGAWNMLHRYDDLFAAAVPICAIGPNSGSAPANLLDDALWAFHARDDSVVSNQTSRTVVNGILAAGQQPLPAYPAPPVTADFAFASPTLDLQYTEYLTGGHGIWGRVYNTPQMYEWMFAHSVVPEPGSLAIGTAGALALIVRRRIARHRALPGHSH